MTKTKMNSVGLLAGATLMVGANTISAATVLINNTPLLFDRVPVGVNDTSWMVGNYNYGGQSGCILTAQRAEATYYQNINRRGPESLQIVSAEGKQAKMRAARGYDEQGATIASGLTEFSGSAEPAGDSAALDAERTAQITAQMRDGHSVTVTGTSPRGTIVTDTYDTNGFGSAYNVFGECHRDIVSIFANSDTDFMPPDERLPAHTRITSAVNLPEVADSLGARLPAEGEQIIMARFDLPSETTEYKDIPLCGDTSAKASFVEIQYTSNGNHTTQGFIPPDGTADLNWNTASTLLEGESFPPDADQTEQLIVDGEILNIRASTQHDHKVKWQTPDGAERVSVFTTLQVSPSTQQNPGAPRIQNGCADGDEILACVTIGDDFASVSGPEDCAEKLNKQFVSPPLGPSYISPSEPERTRLSGYHDPLTSSPYYNNRDTFYDYLLFGPIYDASFPITSGGQDGRDTPILPPGYPTLLPDYPDGPPSYPPPPVVITPNTPPPAVVPLPGSLLLFASAVIPLTVLFARGALNRREEDLEAESSPNNVQHFSEPVCD